MFIGFMVGDSVRYTPNVVDQPPGNPTSLLPGESGRSWEAEFLGYFIQAYYDPEDPLGNRQPGAFLAMQNHSEGYVLGDHSWITTCLSLSM